MNKALLKVDRNQYLMRSHAERGNKEKVDENFESGIIKTVACYLKEKRKKWERY